MKKLIHQIDMAVLEGINAEISKSLDSKVSNKRIFWKITCDVYGVFYVQRNQLGYDPLHYSPVIGAYSESLARNMATMKGERYALGRELMDVELNSQTLSLTRDGLGWSGEIRRAASIIENSRNDVLEKGDFEKAIEKFRLMAPKAAWTAEKLLALLILRQDETEIAKVIEESHDWESIRLNKIDLAEMYERTMTTRRRAPDQGGQSS